MCGPNGHVRDDETTVVESVESFRDYIQQSNGVQTVQVGVVGPISFEDFVAQSNEVLTDAGLTNPTDRNTTMTVAVLVKQTIGKWIGDAPDDVIAQVGSIDKLGLTVAKLLVLSFQANINGVDGPSPCGVLN
jgi:hypothetical protein